MNLILPCNSMRPTKQIHDRDLFGGNSPPVSGLWYRTAIAADFPINAFEIWAPSSITVPRSVQLDFQGVRPRSLSSVWAFWQISSCFLISLMYSKWKSLTCTKDHTPRATSDTKMTVMQPPRGAHHPEGEAKPAAHQLFQAWNFNQEQDIHATVTQCD